MTKYIDRYYLNGEEYGIKFAGGGWQPDPSRTIFYYDFEQNLNDSSGNNVQFSSSGNIGYEEVGGQYVLKSTSSNPYLQLPNTIGNNLTDFAISFFVYPKTGANPTMLFGQFAHNGVNRVGPNIFLYTNDYHVTVRVFGGNEQNVGNLTQNAWQHIVFTRSSGTCTAYLNGQQIGQSFTDNTTWDLTVQDYPDFFIWRNGSQNWNTSGVMLDKMIYENVGWTAQEVSDYYNQTKSLYGIS